jgi:uncharacterized protein (DUF302 family)
MSESSATTPAGARPVDGVAHTRSPHSVAATVDLLTGAIRAAGAKLFAVIDHSGEAQQAGLSLRDTKLLIFGNPVAGTPAMVAAPLAAIDLPLKILIWQDDAGVVWMSYLNGPWLADRHGLTREQAAPLAAAGALTSRVAARSGEQ